MRGRKSPFPCSKLSGNDRQIRILGQKLGILERALADIAAGPHQVELFLHLWAGDPLDEGPGRVLLALVDVGIDGQAPAAYAVGRLHARLHGCQHDPGLAHHLGHGGIAVAGGTHRPGLHVGDEALAKALLAAAPVELHGARRRRLVEELLVDLEALDIGGTVDRGLAVGARGSSRRAGHCTASSPGPPQARAGRSPPSHRFSFSCRSASLRRRSGRPSSSAARGRPRRRDPSGRPGRWRSRRRDRRSACRRTGRARSSGRDRCRPSSISALSRWISRPAAPCTSPPRTGLPRRCPS